ncbi:PQQ-dependent sugar dehydrogenase [Mesorhizobium amorphae]|uniref:PQQ-dependent sugar dehydrogenase n=1 Tax=Mesorhizobium amorphae TaxID=71433 RepID=UPI001781AB1F|nr:PQQ-dependent sugar dehydrogenase [Mesorhizobium amorphae]
MRSINRESLSGHRQSWSIASRAAIASIFIAAAGNARAQDFNLAPPNAADQRPAFPGQTRAPVINDSIQLISTVVAEGLENPWGIAELPDGGWLVTERPGRMRLVRSDGTVSEPIQGVPEVVARGQGGLLDVAVRDDFEESRRVWWSFSQPRGAEGNATAVATGVLSADGAALGDVRVVFQQQPAWRSNNHFGSRLVFDRDGALFVTTGERSQRRPRQLAQDVGTHLGKIIRINPDGGAAPGNPQLEGGLPEIWSFGHRNVQAAALGPDGALWTIEHGPRGGDELNRPEPGKNYGWPIITYGENYSGAPIGEGITARDGMEQPIYYWDPVIAPSGMAFYDGSMFPEWRGSILVGGLSSRSLVRLTLSAGRVAGEARYLEGTGRIRDVAVARDGSIVLLTDDGGQVLRVTRGN